MTSPPTFRKSVAPSAGQLLQSDGGQVGAVLDERDGGVENRGQAHADCQRKADEPQVLTFGKAQCPRNLVEPRRCGREPAAHVLNLEGSGPKGQGEDA